MTTAKNSVYLMLTVLAITSLGLSAAYAEQSTIEVPFDSKGLGCTYDVEKITYTCTWQGAGEFIPTDPGDSTPITQDTFEAEEQTPQEQITPEVIAAPIVKEKLTDTQVKIMALEKKIEAGKISPADVKLYDLLVQLQKVCELGIEHGALIQKYAAFEIPDEVDPRTVYSNFDLSQNVNLGYIEKKIQECELWDKYRVDVLGQRYLDIEVDDSTSQKHHAAMVSTLKQYPQDAPLTEDDLDAEEQTSIQYICGESYFDDNFKRSVGCTFEKAPIVGFADRVNPLDQNPAYVNAQEYYKSDGQYVDLDSLKRNEVTKSRAMSAQAFGEQHDLTDEELAILLNMIQPVEDYNETP